MQSAHRKAPRRECRGAHAEAQRPSNRRPRRTELEADLSKSFPIPSDRSRAGRAAREAALTDVEVVQRFLDGDERAFAILVDRYEGRLRGFVQRIVGDRERAQDLIQETFVRVYRHLHRFDQDRKFSTWIFTIAGNLAKNELRNRSRNPVVLFRSLIRHWDSESRPIE